MCTSGQAANDHTQCRMVSTAESLDAVWGEQLAAQTGTAYAAPDFHLWDGTRISSACGTASSAVGPGPSTARATPPSTST
ncbi:MULTISPECIES: neutral zinc metallopeptidase [unclassified Actinomyces]|uniref:neutral zinc metallopeptidase n=1 Tax=unclassified Actinomyces TaxID=2609248 RepID=UPI0020183528|nr:MULTISPECIES: neutral zinc metallopeptidase [unclassified Actinomyces]